MNFDQMIHDEAAKRDGEGYDLEFGFIFIRGSMEARATALTSWASVALLAVAGAWFSSKGIPARGGLGAAALVLFAAAVIGVRTARPSVWSLVGYDPSVIISKKLMPAVPASGVTRMPVANSQLVTPESCRWM